jgi:hypothetical protein
MVEDRRAAPLRTPQLEDRGQDNRRISFRKASMTAYDHKPCVSAPRPTVTPDTAVSRVTEVPIDKDYTHLLQRLDPEALGDRPEEAWLERLVAPGA